jgi:excisionase family DNA binding protein
MMGERQRDFDPCEALTVKAVAGLLEMAEPTVRGFIRAGLLPSLEIGGNRRVLRTDLQAFLEEHREHGFRSVKGRRPNQARSEEEPPPEGGAIPF